MFLISSPGGKNDVSERPHVEQRFTLLKLFCKCICFGFDCGMSWSNFYQIKEKLYTHQKLYTPVDPGYFYIQHTLNITYDIVPAMIDRFVNVKRWYTLGVDLTSCCIIIEGVGETRVTLHTSVPTYASCSNTFHHYIGLFYWTTLLSSWSHRQTVRTRSTDLS